MVLTLRDRGFSAEMCVRIIFLFQPKTDVLVVRPVEISTSILGIITVLVRTDQ